MIDKTTAFIRKAKDCSANENLDFSQVVYVNNRTKVVVIDHDLRSDGSEYGPFEVTPSNFLRGRRHPDRRGERISRTKQLNQEDFISRCKEVHKNENLDYSKVIYTGAHNKIIIIDNDLDSNGVPYGEYEVEANAFLRGAIHRQKAFDRQSKRQMLSQDEVVGRIKQIHQDKPYTYETVCYNGRRYPITIVCHRQNQKGKEHGPFTNLVDNVLRGEGCPKCGNHISKPEADLYDFVYNELGFEDAVRGDRSVLENNQELDIYIPSAHLAIEFNGLLWHSERYGKDKHYHLNKTIQCNAKNIRLVHIFEDEYTNSPELVKDKIRHILNKAVNASVIGARKCHARKIDYQAASQFLNANHIQGSCRATIYYGLFDESDQLLAVETFTLRNKNADIWELTRYASHVKYSIPGGASKLFKCFMTDYRPNEVYTFMDRRWGVDGVNLYTNMGFELDCVLPPNYSYTDGHTRIHKFLCRKQKLAKQYGISTSKTESEMTRELGLWRIWDCGLFKYKYTAPN